MGIHLKIVYTLINLALLFGPNFEKEKYSGGSCTIEFTGKGNMQWTPIAYSLASDIHFINFLSTRSGTCNTQTCELQRLDHNGTISLFHVWPTVCNRLFSRRATSFLTHLEVNFGTFRTSVVEIMQVMDKMMGVGLWYDCGKEYRSLSLPPTFSCSPPFFVFLVGVCFVWSEMDSFSIFELREEPFIFIIHSNQNDLGNVLFKPTWFRECLIANGGKYYFKLSITFFFLKFFQF